MTTAIHQKENQIKNLENQLGLARREISNLRKQIKAMRFIQEKEHVQIRKELENWRCLGCRNQSNSVKQISSKQEKKSDEDITMKKIGIIRTKFPEKRGTPRQPTICSNSIAKLSLTSDIFTNPSHALQGLQEFSHMWILFNFHKNEPTHKKAKVAPPRLNGVKIGVFASRSPHRPNPIGLSLVKIDKIEGNDIYFFGVDIVDETPVLDIKPYIPQYDNPFTTFTTKQEEETNLNNLDMLNTSELAAKAENIKSGERCPENQIRVPTWIDQSSVEPLNVVFEEDVLIQLEKFKSEDKDLKNEIQNVLREDPRSVYLRERWAGHCYTFNLSNINVSCKFNDKLHTVTVYQILPREL